MALAACSEPKQEKSSPGAEIENKAAAERTKPAAESSAPQTKTDTEKMEELEEQSIPADTEDPLIPHAK
ncbi:hypothetical protein [Nitrosomonas communis]|uniref:hypothetical protein n=1 Tax=Nitrosomonas communis TaxID=44574 RepID=UPI000942580E|nr:hypothetical protein [Nitrosomonas communis]